MANQISPEEAAVINKVARLAFDNAYDHGFWNDKPNLPEKIALMHSELSEALEVLRKDPTARDTKVPEISALGAEMADVVIRVFDFCYMYGINIGEAIRLKHEYNTTRPYKHGKAF
jgi:NTP pyrophosphatase (non-canonical NTP hydrolase)